MDRVFTDTVSGKSITRPQLQAMLAFVRDGDVVIVHSMDRLARSLDDLRRSGPRADRSRCSGALRLRAAVLHRRAFAHGRAAAVGTRGLRRVRAWTERFAQNNNAGYVNTWLLGGPLDGTRRTATGSPSTSWAPNRT